MVSKFVQTFTSWFFNKFTLKGRLDWFKEGCRSEFDILLRWYFILLPTTENHWTICGHWLNFKTNQITRRTRLFLSRIRRMFRNARSQASVLQLPEPFLKLKGESNLWNLASEAEFQKHLDVWLSADKGYNIKSKQTI